MNIFLRWPGGKPKALTFSFDDGVESDIRLAHLLDQYDMRGTFNISTELYAPEGTVHEKDAFFRRMTQKQILDNFVSSHHELAVHALTHPFLGQMPIACAMHEVIEDRKNIETMVKKPVRGMAYPYGDCSEELIAMLKSAGFLYARLACDSHGGFSLPKEPLAYAPTCHYADPDLMTFAKRFVEDDINTLHPYDSHPYLFCVWGHTFEFERDHNWDIIETFLPYTAHRKDVYYATNSDIFAYSEKWHRLEFTADGRIAYNPTDTDLYLLYNGRDEMVKSGETKRLSLD